MKIAFTGDMAFSKYFKDRCTDENLLSSEVRDFLASSDYTVVNVEGSVSSGEISAAKPLVHANPPECADFLKSINGRIWNLANNHSMDCGSDGAFDTLKCAEENDCYAIGVGRNIEEASKPLIISEGAGVGFVSVTVAFDKDALASEDKPGSINIFDINRIKAQIDEVKSKCRWCVVVAHANEEFCQIPMPNIRRLYKKYLKMGADIIVGHHPHVVENYETFGDKIVFYSLGNFIFDTDYQRAQKYTDAGVLVKIAFGENDFSWEYMPTKINRDTHTITKGDCPGVFTDISTKDYNLLWPLQAKHLRINEKKKVAFIRPEMKNYNGWQWFVWAVKKAKKEKRGRVVAWGLFLEIFKYWKLSKRKDIIEYIKRG